MQRSKPLSGWMRQEGIYALSALRMAQSGTQRITHSDVASAFTMQCDSGHGRVPRWRSSLSLLRYELSCAIGTG